MVDLTNYRECLTHIIITVVLLENSESIFEINKEEVTSREAVFGMKTL